MKKAKYLLLSTLIFSSLSVTQITSANNSEEIQFNSCSEAWAAGYANIKHGEVGYRPKLDKDNDGKACELEDDKKGEYKREGQPLNKLKTSQPEAETTTPEKTNENDTKKPNISDKTTTPELNINHDNKENSSSTKTQILGVELTSKPTENTTIKEENDHNQKTTATLKPTPKKITPKKETHESHTKKALPKTSAVK